MKGGRSMETIRNGNDSGRNYIVEFRKILKEAEERDRQAMDRFHNWYNGTMDPAEDKAYTDAVQQCARNLKQDLRSA